MAHRRVSSGVALRKVRQHRLFSLRSLYGPPIPRIIPPTSSPHVRPYDPTIASVLPFLRTIFSTPGTNNATSFLRRLFTVYLLLQYNNSDGSTLQKIKGMIELSKMIVGIGHEQADPFPVKDQYLNDGSGNGHWSTIIPTYRLQNYHSARQPILDLAGIKLCAPTKEASERWAVDVLPPEKYEWVLCVLISYIIRILGSDCVPVVMRPVVTEELRRYIEPLTRIGKRDSITLPAPDGTPKLRFRLLGLSDAEVKKCGWLREGQFGWSHIKEEGDEIQPYSA
jgi:hypothetical protein